MKTAMENIRDMVNVNTVVGDAVETPDGLVVVPVSRVSFGFAAGGGEYQVNGGGGAGGGGGGEEQQELPFAGGSGGGVTVQPVGFLVVGQGNVRLLPVDRSAFYDRLLDLAPHLLDQVWSLAQGNGGGARSRGRQEGGGRGQAGFGAGEGNRGGRYRPAES